MTTAICIGDPHFMVENIPEVEKFIDNIEKLVLEKKPDMVICLGDLLHTHERLHTIPLNKAYDLINRLRKLSKTYVLVGNHDMCNNQQFLTENHWMNGMKEWDNVTIVDQVVYNTINNHTFIFSPYVYPGRFEEALNTLSSIDWKNSTCIFAHQEFYGCKMGAIISTEGDKWSLEYPNVISGHIHSKQNIQKNIYYTGSAMQHAFGESEQNIIAYVTFNKDKTYTLEEIDLKLPRKKIVYKDIEDLEDYKINKSEDKIKITVSGNYEQFKSFKKTQKYKDIITSGTKVVFKPKKIEKKVINDSSSNTIETNDNNFKTILNNIITNEKNTYLFQAYQLIINDKEYNCDDVI